jgi:DNA-binding NtrC family response regulator
MAQPCDTIRVLVVDDDVAFRTGLAENLIDDGHVVNECGDPSEVPADLIRRAHVVLTDYQMASIDGLKFADAVHDIRPDTTVVLTTAYWTVEIETAVAVRPFVQLCRKPVDYDELHELVHQLVR